jgi:hypothetical protein
VADNPAYLTNPPARFVDQSREQAFVAEANPVPRFVVLEHDWPAPHWDFLLEAGDVLRAWRLLAEPAGGREVTAEPNFDHRTLYLDYEGPLSGDRGSVVRWDAGEFEWVADESGRVVVNLRGAKLAGRVELRHADERWVFVVS